MQEDSSMKALAAYFSAGGVTARAAQAVAEAAGADLFESKEKPCAPGAEVAEAKLFSSPSDAKAWGK